MSKSNAFNSIVWWSSKESRTAEKVSVLAVVETIASVAGFWWLTQAYGLELLLLTSVILAFFVLLRSPESISKGVKMFEAYTTEDPEKKFSNAHLALSALCAGAAGWWLATHWLVGYEGSALFWRAACIGWLAFSLGTAITMAIVGPGAKVGKKMAVGAIVGAGAGTVAVALAEAGTVAVAGAAAAVIAGAALAAITRVAVAVSVVAYIIIAPGVTFGITLRAIAVRLWVTSCHFFQGFPCFAENWTALAFKTDLRTPPELIPGLPDDHLLHFSKYFRTMRTMRTADGLIVNFLSFVFFYLPSVFYRYYLKSTAWLYFPLIWVARVPGQLRDANGGLLWDRAQRRSLVAKMGFVLASLTVAVFVWRYVDPATVLGAIETVSENSGLPAHPLLMFAGFEFAKIDGLYWLPPAAAACVVGVYLWTNHVHTRVDFYPDEQPRQWKVRAILWLNNLAAGLAYAWIGIGVFELAWVNYEACLLPQFIQQAVGTIFAPATCGA